MLETADQHESGSKTEPGADSGGFWRAAKRSTSRPTGQADLYEWIARTLREHGYKGLPETGKGLVKPIHFKNDPGWVGRIFLGDHEAEFVRLAADPGACLYRVLLRAA